MLSKFMINQLDLFGLRKSASILSEMRVSRLSLKPPVYRLVHHPLTLGFIIAFWATPRMLAVSRSWGATGVKKPTAADPAYELELFAE
jgi:hypothetical protein